MFEVLKTFYTTHYNFAALSLLLLLLFIFLMTKKNVRVGIVVLAAFVALNVILFKKTDGKAWTIYIDQPAVTDIYGQRTTPPPLEMTFSAKKNWTITDEKGEVHHWCWFDAAWDRFASTDVVAWIWGENASKKMMKSSETRLNEDSGSN